MIKLESKGHAILSWSVNPPEVCRVFEENVPDIEKRLEAMRSAAAAGYPVRAVMMPIIPIDGWRDIYADFTRHLLETAPIKRLTLGGICSYTTARRLMEIKSGLQNTVSLNLDEKIKSSDGTGALLRIIETGNVCPNYPAARKYRPQLEVALCLEEKEFRQTEVQGNNIGGCNCVW